MKIKRNRFIPFKDFSAINIFGVIYARRDTFISDRTIRHEQIHTAQMKEMLYILFYLWYAIEWFIRFIVYGFKSHKAYLNTSFEREAYKHQDELDYARLRNRFEWLKHI